MNSGLPGATFRDPSGSLSFLPDGGVLRTVQPSARAETLSFLETTFCISAQRRGELIAAEVDDSSPALRLHHPRIPFPTYPWEWTPSQWLAAAELTLTLCEQAVTEGWLLKDATPLNVLFDGPRAVFVDILSFEPRRPSVSIWLAYGQYVRTFLLPLVMRRQLRWPLSLSLFHRDGYEPADCFQALSLRQRLSRSALWPITLPTLLDRGKGAAQGPAKTPTRELDPEVATRVLQRTLADLRRRTRRAAGTSGASDWSGYTGALTHYTANESRAKFEWVRTTLTAISPTRVLDIGANTGEFSILSAEAGAEVVALERDLAAADRIFLAARDRSLPIHTICADLARPTPSVGWRNSESLALLPRLEGQFDCVLMLAVIHHLILMEQIPIPAILELCARLTRRYLVIEWVPVEDPMFQSLMRGRDSLYGSLSEADLLAACEGRFTVRDRHPLSNNRVLFLFEKLGNGVC
ncbi:MAG TPA: class I SAM-dependent methyltransferase [Acidobacteriaceae bacterium]|nr:class I SAM-dependent methyltransferase [Acidobacteriaceae bacterium]